MFHICRHLSVVARGLGRSIGGSYRCAALTLDLPFQAGCISSCGGSCECYALSPIAVVCRWPLLLLSLLLSAQPAVAAGLAASPALIPAVRCSTRLSGLREHLQRGNARDRTYGARHERTTQPLQRHRMCRGQWRLPARPGRVRGGSRPGRHGAGPRASSARTWLTRSSAWSRSLRPNATPPGPSYPMLSSARPCHPVSQQTTVPSIVPSPRQGMAMHNMQARRQRAGRQPRAVEQPTTRRSLDNRAPTRRSVWPRDPRRLSDAARRSG
jgi:hypothetical protein